MPKMQMEKRSQSGTTKPTVYLNCKMASQIEVQKCCKINKETAARKA